jgi:hypothetical protein
MGQYISYLQTSKNLTIQLGEKSYATFSLNSVYLNLRDEVTGGWKKIA